MPREKKFTPGPWSIDRDLVYGPPKLHTSGLHSLTSSPAIAFVRMQATSEEETTANALLIAAAPDLFEALEALAAIPVERFTKGNGPGNTPESVIAAWHLYPGQLPVELTVGHVFAARAALSKALGSNSNE